MSVKHATTGLQVSVWHLMLFQVCGLFVREFARLRMEAAGWDPRSAAHLSALAGFFVLAVLLWPVIRENRFVIIRLFRAPVLWGPILLRSVGIGLALRAASWCLMIAVIALGLQQDLEPSGGAGPLFWWHCPPVYYLAVSLIVMAVLTPLFEELISRGLILGTLRERGVNGAVVISAALFAILHAANNVPIAFIFGIIAAIQMINTRTLWGPVFSHATFNGMITIDWDCLNGVWTPESASVLLAAGFAALAAVFVLVAFCIARLQVPGPANRPGTLPA